ncbi:MAG: alpha-N-acetylglucosaminidase N-terminal domain-containing protein, partial [Muribaculaceae bacterium]|nr:alpha-N-acetylglucosaminidase N-terminal domain-containing protein [Muribaculaceae bacterium]
MNLKCLALLILSLIPISLCANPVTEMLDRIDNGASKKFVIELKKGDADFFELDQKGTKPVIRGNNWINIATGVNWYLKYYAGVHLSWNGMKAT